MKTNKLLVLVGLLVLSNGALAEPSEQQDSKTLDKLTVIINYRMFTQEENNIFEAIRRREKLRQQRAAQQAAEQRRQYQMAAQQAAEQRRQSMIQFLINQDMARLTHQW